MGFSEAMRSRRFQVLITDQCTHRQAKIIRRATLKRSSSTSSSPICRLAQPCNGTLRRPAGLHTQRFKGWCKQRSQFIHSFSISVTEDGRNGPVRFLGVIPNAADDVAKMAKRLSKHWELDFCYEASGCG